MRGRRLARESDSVDDESASSESRSPEAPALPQSGHIVFTPRSKTVLALAERQSLDQGQDQIGTEHLLLALLLVKESVATQLLGRLAAGPDQLRGEVSRLLADEGRPLA